MFSDQQNEQKLYHSIATVATLLLQIGEVGKAFQSQSQKVNSATPTGDESCDGISKKQQRVVKTTASGDGCCEGQGGKSAEVAEDLSGTGEMGTTGKDCGSGDKEDHRRLDTTTDSGTGEKVANKVKVENVRHENENGSKEPEEGNEESPKLGNVCKEKDTFQPDVTQNTNGAKSQVVNETDSSCGAGAGADRPIDASRSTTAIGRAEGPIDESRSVSTRQTSVSSCSLVDPDWSITFEQFLASILTEPPLVQHFEEQIDINIAIEYYRNRSQIL